MDNTLVKTITISKNDRFYFSRNYDRNKIMPLLFKVEVLYQTIKDLPILPSLASHIDEEIIRRSIFGTAAIEGNTLTEEEVGRILSEEDKKIVKKKSEKEIENLKIAYTAVDSFEEVDHLPLSEELILSIHSTIMEGFTETGRKEGYRDKPVKVGDKEHGGTYRAPGSFKDMTLLMKEFISWIESEPLLKEDSMLRAAMAHYHLALIHPFTDGNGRTARMLEALLLQTSGVRYAPKMLSNYYYQHVDDYYWVFSLSEKNREKDITPFIEFNLQAMVSSLEMVKSRVLLFIRLIVLRDYFSSLRRNKNINQRQYDLLCILIENPVSIIIPDLYSSAPFAILYRGKSERSARRDLNNLLKYNLLFRSEDGKYELNMKT
ncbi:MAG: Fic family protein [Candidatus Latescibacterota bacterium]